MQAWADAGCNPTCGHRRETGKADARRPQAEVFPVPLLSRAPSEYPRRFQSRRRERPGTPKKCKRRKGGGGGETGRARLIVVGKGVARLVSSRSGERRVPQNVKTHVPLSASERWRPYAPAHSRALTHSRAPEGHVTRQRQCLWEDTPEEEAVSLATVYPPQPRLWQATPEAAVSPARHARGSVSVSLVAGKTRQREWNAPRSRAAYGPAASTGRTSFGGGGSLAPASGASSALAASGTDARGFCGRGTDGAAASGASSAWGPWGSAPRAPRSCVAASGGSGWGKGSSARTYPVQS